MNDFDRIINETLSQEDQKLIEELQAEPGFFHQIFGVFRGSTGWVNLTLMVTQTIMFIAAVWMTFQFFAATDATSQLRWGLPTVVLFLGGAIMKTAVVPTIQANRILHALHRLELVLIQRDQVK